ncbi:proton extrusion protein PcxA [Waterburya agarophytonicola K14]|uniref:Proton extrusion protein PxcA n=1 Tax=Waterburya agarophytonicola KI4 TaxID=2874699 RepID=A0A964FEQ4_9CYAN|nr:proton extrusion protein PcxA [Waterburya agarophytonicola]MCC0176157.1 proton extrusion protein PcxA [Waterburya agarophytonicola KI4]
MKLLNIFNVGRRWLSATPQRALDAAYGAAIKIKAIEDDHFDGQIVSASSMEYSESVIKVFRNDVNSYLNTIKARLAEFRLSRGLLIFSDTQPNDSSQTIVRYTNGFEDPREFTIIEKLAFIDAVTDKYNNYKYEEVELIPTRRLEKSKKDNRLIIDKNNRTLALNRPAKETNGKETNTETITDKTSVLPRSFMRTLNRIRQEIDPKADDTEEEVVKRFRKSRNKTAISIRFLLILIIVPLLTHQASKSLIITPLVKQYFTSHEQEVLFINHDMEEEAFMELHRYEEQLHFRSMIGTMPRISQEEEEEKIKRKAEELSEEFQGRGINAIGNVFADLFSLLAFTGIIFFCKREIQVIKSFLDEIAYGLSDSAKAFLIILLTDMFVGYHSPHGWEIILEGIARHLGLPENREFNFLFIATFPVILDTVLKYWIFRYLNRISPSSVATYKNMNE